MLDFAVFVLVLGFLGWGAAQVVERRTVYEYQHALLFKNGTYTGILQPGVYWLSKLDSRVEVVDARLRILSVPGQEILSQDGVTLKVSVLIEYRISDPKVATLVHADYMESLYALVQKELRLLIGSVPIESILENKHRIGTDLHERVQQRCSDLGLEIKTAEIKDVMFPGPLKEAFSQVARARQEGLAALERTRAESAALRNLANAAKMLESNPDLYRLRLLQSVGDASSVVVHLDPDATAKSDAVDRQP